jgi:hypothetical protein
MIKYGVEGSIKRMKDKFTEDVEADSEMYFYKHV